MFGYNPESDDDDDNEGPHADEFLKFERIPKADRPSTRPDVCAFLLLDKLVPGKCDLIDCAWHDCFSFSISTEELAEAGITEKQVVYLIRCGVLYHEESECLGMYA